MVYLTWHSKPEHRNISKLCFRTVPTTILKVHTIPKGTKVYKVSPTIPKGFSSVQSPLDNSKRILKCTTTSAAIPKGPETVQSPLKNFQRTLNYTVSHLPNSNRSLSIQINPQPHFNNSKRILKGTKKSPNNSQRFLSVQRPPPPPPNNSKRTINCTKFLTIPKGP